MLLNWYKYNDNNTPHLSASYVLRTDWNTKYRIIIWSSEEPREVGTTMISILYMEKLQHSG